ncbi:MAG TPA: amino acid ABC transporter substrate-binding protein [Candidatus Eisenbacteria bacterium]|nr:amino acid ABC transporter substrate-binding protein [Candidatus Eisenbacteria bacterium]
MGLDGWVSRQPRWSGRALVGLLLLAVACGTTAQPPPVRQGSDLLVGASLSLTGSLAGEGQLTQQGYQMWLDWINGQGGIEVAGVRHRVQLLLRDDQSRPDLSEALATDLVKGSGVQFLLGPYGSDSTAAVAAVAEQYQVPLVEAGGAAQAIFSRGYRYTFGVLSLTDQYMSGVIDMVGRLAPRPRTIALLAADDRFSQEVAESVRDRGPMRGMEIVLSLSYPAGSTDVTALVARAAAVQPDILVNSGHLAEAVAIHRAARAEALDARVFAYSVGPSTPEFIAELGPDADYVFAGAQWTPQMRYRPQTYLTAPAYVAAYKRRFRTLLEPAYQTAQATAAGLALQRAIEDAHTTQPQAVRDALAGLDVMTFYGRLKFDSRGANVYKPMVVEQIQHSRHHTVYPPEVADAMPAYPTPPWSVRA